MGCWALIFCKRHEKGVRVCAEPMPSFHLCGQGENGIKDLSLPQHRAIPQKPYICWHWRGEITLANGP